MIIGFGSREAAERLQKQAREALGVTAPVKAMTQGERRLWAVEMPPLTATQYDQLRKWQAEPKQGSGAARRR